MTTSQHEPDIIIPRAMVFDTPELLESTLLQLPMFGLLRAQRANRTFHDAVKKSPSIQRALFFRPCGDYVARFEDPDELFWSEDCASNEVCNSFDGSSWFNCATREKMKCRWVCSTSDRPCDVVFNPLLSFIENIRITDVYIDEITPETRDLDADEWEFQEFVAFRARLEIGQLPWDSEADAPWKSMLLSQPAVKNMLVDTFGASHYHVLRAYENTAGITVHQLQQFLAAYPNKWSRIADIWAGKGFRITAIDSTAAETMAEINDAVNVQEREDAENWEMSRL